MASGKAVTVRLDDDELQQLRKLPGDSDAARLRTLLHATGATDGLALKIAEAVRNGLSPDFQETQKLVRAVVPPLKQIYELLADPEKRRPS